MAADSSGSRGELTRQAEKYLRQGRMDQAVECYQRLADLAPTDWNIVKQLADLSERAGQRETAAVRFAQLADHLFHEGFRTKASALYKKVLKLDSANEHAWWQLAELALEQKLRLDARHALSQVLELRRRRRDTAGADEVLLRLAELDPNDVKTRASAAQVPRADESPAEALARLRQVATELDATGDARAANTVWRDVLVRQSDAADVRVRLIRHAVDSGEMSDALQLAAALDTGVPDQLALRLEVTHRAGLHADVCALVAGRVAAGDRAREMLGWLNLLASRPLREACVVGAVEALRAAGDTRAASDLIAAFTSATAEAPASLFLLWVELCVDADLDQLNAAQQGLAAAHLQHGRVSDARAVAEDLVLRQPSDGASRGLLLDIYRSAGEPDPESALARLMAPPVASEPDGEPVTDVERDPGLEVCVEPDAHRDRAHLTDDRSSAPPWLPEHQANLAVDRQPLPALAVASEELASDWTRQNPEVQPAVGHEPVPSVPLPSRPDAAVPGRSMDAWLAEVTAAAPVAEPSASEPVAAAGFDWASLLGRHIEPPPHAAVVPPRPAVVVEAMREAPLVTDVAVHVALRAEPTSTLTTRVDSHGDAALAPARPSESGADVDSAGDGPAVGEPENRCELAPDTAAAADAAWASPSPEGEVPPDDVVRPAQLSEAAAQPQDIGRVEVSDPDVEPASRDHQRAEWAADGPEGRPEALPADAPGSHPGADDEDDEDEIDLTELLEQLKQFDPVLPEMRPRTAPFREEPDTSGPDVQCGRPPEDLLADLADADGTGETHESDLNHGFEPIGEGPPAESGDSVSAEEDLAAVFADMQERTGDRTLASQQLAAGRVFAAAGLAAEAARAFERASSELRSRFEAGHALAELHRSRGQLLEAVRWYEVAASAPVADAAMRRAVLYDLSETLETLGETERALGVVLDLLSEVEDYRDARARADRLLSVDAGG